MLVNQSILGIINRLGVGKSCLLLNFIGKGFRTEHSGTVGVEFGHRITDVGQKTIKFHIWDTVYFFMSSNIMIERLDKKSSSL